MTNAMLRRARPVALSLKRAMPERTGLGRLLVVDVPTDLLLVCAWAAVGLVASVSLAVSFPLADPVGTLLALG